MRILHLIGSTAPASGGLREALVQLSPHIERAGHQGVITTLDAPETPDIEVPGAQVIPLGGRGKYGYSPSLRRWLRQEAPTFDVAIVHGLWQFHGRAALQTLPGRLPWCVYPHGMLDPWFNHAHPLKYLKKLPYWLLNERWLLGRAARVIFTTEDEARAAARSFPLSSWRPEVCSLGVTLPAMDDETARSAFLDAVPDLQPGEPYLLFLGRIHRKKAVDVLLDAYARMHPAGSLPRLVVAGPDEQGLVSDLQGHARVLGVSARVLWPGMLRGAAKWGALRGASAFLLPSHQENFGIAVVEALGCGTPVVISDKVNIWREIALDEAGIVTDDTVAGFAAGLRRFLSLSEPSRAAMRTRAAGCFRRRFDAAAAAAQLLVVLEAVVRSS